MFRLYTCFRLLGLIALIVYFAAAALFLGARYWILPNIDQWRSNIEMQLSRSLQTTVHLEHVSARWTGINPSIQLEGVELVDDADTVVMQLPSIRAELSWRSLFQESLEFVSIEALGLQLAVRRDQNEHLWVLGRSFALNNGVDSPGFGPEHPLIQWLSRQRHLILRDATIAWRDETRSNQPLILSDVLLGLYTDEAGHSLKIQARPNAEIGENFELLARFDQIDETLPAPNPQAWDGALYIAIDGLAPGGWRPWLDVPSRLVSGQVSGQWWFTWEGGVADRFAAHIDATDSQWTTKADNLIQAHVAQLTVSGPWADVERLVQSVAPPDHAGDTDFMPQLEAVPPDSQRARGLHFRAMFKEAGFRVESVLEHPLQFDEIELVGMLHSTPDQGWKATLDKAYIENDDMALSLGGTWVQGLDGTAGVADLQGHFSRASINAIARYMPQIVNKDAREWMESGLLAGELYDAVVVLKGELDHFPFEHPSDPGDFWIVGDYRDVIIDYAPTVEKRPGWPRLTDMRGKASLHRVDLRLIADEATVWPTDAEPIRLKNIRAQIPNIEHKSVLTVQGDSNAGAGAYLALIRHSPLRTMLDGVLDTASGQGQWEVPLRLTVPLLDTDETTVAGAVYFGEDTIALWPEVPAFNAVEGALLFTDTGMEASRLRARFLGGSMSIEGGVGGPHNGLKILGRMTSASLSQHYDLPVMKSLDGDLAYEAGVQRLASGRYAFSMQSDLKGMQMRLPSPFGKNAESSMPLSVQWTPKEHREETELTITLGNEVAALLTHRPSASGGAYFESASLGIGRPSTQLNKGASIDVQQQQIDLGAWMKQLDALAMAETTTQTLERSWLPELETVRLQADRIEFLGNTFDQSTLTGRQTAAGQWRVDISSTQTAGTLFFEESNGKIEGKVRAKFDRLAIGSIESGSGDRDDSSSTVGDDLDIPAIDLDVDKFSLYGRSVGHLTVEGVNQKRGTLWRLNRLTLTSPGATLTGSGLWRLSGPERGLTLDANVEVLDGGDYLDQIDLKNIMEGGKGTLTGQVEWRNMPWQFERSDINGSVNLTLESGRFSTLNSRSARLLELLSLQSLQRLANLNFNPSTLFKEGFPFDRLSGDLQIREGLMTTNNYQLVGPVGTISLGGDINLISEELDLQAMVVPNLDISGATLAAGLAINPVVGVGAFLTQWLLRKPLAKAMTAHYRVRGNWDDPEVEGEPGANATQGMRDKTLAP